MRKISVLFKESIKEFKSVRCITFTAMLGAISVVLGSLRIDVTPFLRISFSFLPNRFVFYLFGPAVGGIYGAAMDILTFIIKPSGAFHPGITFNAFITGVIYGLVLYKKPATIKRIFIADIIQMIIVNLLLQTYWLTGLTGLSFFALFPPRALKALIMLPIETLLFYSAVKAVEATGIKKILSGRGM
ncbi:ECF transporter S component (folate family) [Herbinix hemicellulosilytica]|uniref:Putative membrane protein n=1 Tax=Herbinix hemicellulosilytica TaxID=1564487 RepID=A0A0H5SJC8_HERHM|nr:folate family ECF transporter S component [Herbinix hemicellulosilytica]RBP59382.1 ECF transporter S component (folate family) [Herbinix hemicellulosilytica]CRZ34896.1 putative membrane protein [Herbinix hemicellulosilytica]